MDTEALETFVAVHREQGFSRAARVLNRTQPAISRHLKVLEGAGLIVRRVEGTKRPCRLAPQAISEIDQWLAMLRQALSANYDRLDDALAAMQTEH